MVRSTGNMSSSFSKNLCSPTTLEAMTSFFSKRFILLQQAFSDESINSWFIETGKTLLANILVKSDHVSNVFKFDFC